MTRWTGLLVAALLLRSVPGHAARQAACTPLDSMAPWARVNRAWSAEAGTRWSNDSLRQVLMSLAARDQAARKDLGSRVGDSAYARALGALDATLATALAAILDRYGLPTRSLVGAAGADAAMLITQHSWSLQERVLGLALKAAPDEISPQALAMLEDRVLVHQGKSQRYGTQFNLGANGVFHFAVTHDLAGLEARRTRMGIPPLGQYVCLMEEAGMRIDRSSLPPMPGASGQRKPPASLGPQRHGL